MERIQKVENSVTIDIDYSEYPDYLKTFAAEAEQAISTGKQELIAALIQELDVLEIELEDLFIMAGIRIALSEALKEEN
jgi:hypothetical protein